MTDASAQPVIPPVLNVVENSSALEHLLEHIFLAEVLQEAWFSRGEVVDVLHTSVDAFGYDVVLQLNGITRHIQLKARRQGSKTSAYKINSILGQHASGCIVWIGWERNPATNRIDLEYRWFGDEPGRPLPDLGDVVAKHSKGDSTGTKKDRPHIRRLGLGKFEKLSGVEELLAKLFGARVS